MVDFRIRVVLDTLNATRATAGLTRNLRTATGAADRLRASMVGVTQAFLAIQAGRGILNIVDEFTTYQNRLRVVTADTEELAAVTDELFKVANRTRVAFSATATLFSRTALATKGFGRSQQEVLDFVETVNKSVILSGTTAREASAGLIQFSQGLSRGVLRGDEFRSVTEQLQGLSNLLQESFGVTRGELIQLAESGQLTTDRIFAAVEAGAKGVAISFEETVPTIAQSFTILRNTVVQFVGELDRSNRFSKTLSETILALANNTELFTKSILALSTVIVTKLVGQALSSLIVALKQVSILLIKNPLTLLPALIALAAGALVGFGDKVFVAQNSLANLQDFAKAVFEGLTNVITGSAELLGGAFSEATDRVQTDFDTSFRGITTIAAQVLDDIIGITRGVFDALVIIWSNLPSAILLQLDLVLLGFRNLNEAILKGAVAVAVTISEVFGRIFKNLRDIAASSGAAIGSALAGNAEAFSSQVDSIEASTRLIKSEITGIPKAFAGVSNRLRDLQILPDVELSEGSKDLGLEIINAIGDGIDSSTAVEDALGRTFDRAEDIARERLRREAEEANRGAGVDLTQRPTRTAGTAESLARGNQLLSDRNKLLQELNGPLDELIRQQDAANFLLKEGIISGEQYAQVMQDIALAAAQAGNSIEDGFTRGLIAVENQINDLASLTETTLVNAFTAAEDAMTQFALTGKTDFKGLVDSIRADVARLLSRQVFQALFSLLGAGGGTGQIAGLLSGIFGAGSPSGLPAGASAGPISLPSTGNQAAAVSSGPGGGGGFATAGAAAPVNVTVANISDPNEAVSALDSSDGERMILNVISKNKSAVKKSIS